MIPPNAEETIHQQAEEIAALRAEILKQNDDMDAALAIRLSGTVTALRTILGLPDLPPSQDLAEVASRTTEAIWQARAAIPSAPRDPGDKPRPMYTERDIYVDDVTSGRPVLRFERPGFDPIAVTISASAAGILSHALACCDRISQSTGWGRSDGVFPCPGTSGSLVEWNDPLKAALLDRLKDWRRVREPHRRVDWWIHPSGLHLQVSDRFVVSGDPADAIVEALRVAVEQGMTGEAELELAQDGARFTARVVKALPADALLRAVASGVTGPVVACLFDEPPRAEVVAKAEPGKQPNPAK